MCTVQAAVTTCVTHFLVSNLMPSTGGFALSGWRA
jgi:hypothetical protein